MLGCGLLQVVACLSMHSVWGVLGGGRSVRARHLGTCLLLSSVASFLVQMLSCRLTAIPLVFTAHFAVIGFLLLAVPLLAGLGTACLPLPQSTQAAVRLAGHTELSNLGLWMGF